MELWISLADIGYPNYSVSNMGRVRNDKSKNIVNGSKSNSGYISAALRHSSGILKTEYVHRLILFAFKGDPPDPSMTVDHLNNNRDDNRLINLRWATYEEQAANRRFSPASIGYKKVEQRSLDGTLIKTWNSRTEAANALNLDMRKISEACSQIKDKKIYGGFIWSNPPDEIYDDEIWKECADPNFKEFYISSFGRIRTKRGKITFGSESNGYKMTSVRINGIKTTRKVHCLVAETFFGKKDLLVNHKDGNKANNKIDNLEYVTYQENAQHAHDTKLHPGTKTRPIIQYDLNNNEIARFNSVKDAKASLEKGDITSALTGRTKTAGGFIWKYAN